MHIILYETDAALRFYPLTLTRPCFDLRSGGTTLRELLGVVFPDASFEYVIRDYLKDASEKSAKVSKGPVLVLDSLLAPDAKALLALKKKMGKKSFLLTSVGKIRGAYFADGKVPASVSRTYASFARSLDGAASAKEDIALARFSDIWHPITMNKQLLSINLPTLAKGHTLLKKGVYVGKKVLVAKETHFDTSEGPIVIDDGVKIMPFSYLAGPLHIGADSLLRPHTSISHSSIGPVCKLGGEIEGSVVQGYSNKQHSGYLGNSYVGTWVNMGGGTGTSDLKNTYGTIKVRGKDTGTQFLGTIVGDLAKTAINTALFGGKIVGVSALVYGTVTSDVPSFANYLFSAKELILCPLSVTLVMQERMHARRGKKVTTLETNILKESFKLTEAERKAAGVREGAISFL